MRTLGAFLLLCGITVGATAQGIYLDTHLPNAHPMKRELLEKLHKWGKATIVNLPEQADLILQLDQTDKLGGLASPWTVRGNAGCAVLKDRRTGEELWSETKGGAWQMSGWSTATVGKKLGDDLVKFLKQR
jgi:hypothetical protein